MNTSLSEISRRVTSALSSVEQRTAETVSANSDIIPLEIAYQRLEGYNSHDALGLIPVYRALQIISTAAGQLPIEQHSGQKVLPPESASPVIRRPDPTISRSQWVQECVMSLATDGNLFIRIVKAAGKIARLQVLPPKQVHVTEDKRGNIIYIYNGDVQENILHQKFMPIPGKPRGMGPIQAARQEISGAIDIRDYATGWFNSSGQPSGLLAGPSIKTTETANAIRDAWNKAATDPNNTSRIRVLGGDLKYTPLLLDPAEAQWLDARKFTVTDIARLFGIPSALMLVSLDGNSLTYSNVEQEWVAFTRFTLIEYLRKIEDVLSELSPPGTKARFNLEALLRGDTSARYKSYSVGINSGFLTPDEARTIEGFKPLTKQQEEQIIRMKKTAGYNQEETA